MKNILIFIGLSCLALMSQAQAVYQLNGVRISPENQALFEKIEVDYVSKVAQDAVNKGQLVNWALIKLDGTIGEANTGYNYIFVNGFASIDAMNESTDWWSNTKAIVGVDPDILYRDLREASGIYYYQRQMEIAPTEAFEYIIMNFGHANNLEGYLKGEKAWMAYHKKNMSKTGLKAWGVGAKFLPVNANQTTNVMTWNAFATKAAAMKVLANDVKGTGDWPETNLDEIMPDGWETIVLGQILSATSPAQ